MYNRDYRLRENVYHSVIFVGRYVLETGEGNTFLHGWLFVDPITVLVSAKSDVSNFDRVFRGCRFRQGGGRSNTPKGGLCFIHVDMEICRQKYEEHAIQCWLLVCIIIGGSFFFLILSWITLLSIQDIKKILRNSFFNILLKQK